MDIDEALKFVQDNISKEDASMVFYAMRQEFDWVGTVFCEDDIKEEIASRRNADDKEPYTDEQMEEAVANVMDDYGWSKWIEGWLTEQGWEALGTIIWDVVEYPEQQEDN